LKMPRIFLAVNLRCVLGVQDIFYINNLFSLQRCESIVSSLESCLSHFIERLPTEKSRLALFHSLYPPLLHIILWSYQHCKVPFSLFAFPQKFLVFPILGQRQYLRWPHQPSFKHLIVIFQKSSQLALGNLESHNQSM
jgi:hypothetical protein